MRDIIKEKGKVYLVDGKGKHLASFRLKKEFEGGVLIESWKAHVKGKGYGKELIHRYVDNHPNIWFIRTDGFTEAGQKNIERALKDWKVVEWRYSFQGGTGMLMHQDAIDYFIEEEEKGKRHLFRFPEEWHSRNK